MNDLNQDKSGSCVLLAHCQTSPKLAGMRRPNVWRSQSCKHRTALEFLTPRSCPEAVKNDQPSGNVCERSRLSIASLYGPAGTGSARRLERPVPANALATVSFRLRRLSTIGSGRFVPRARRHGIVRHQRRLARIGQCRLLWEQANTTGLPAQPPIDYVQSIPHDAW